jgi:hypothetical protein
MKDLKCIRRPYNESNDRLRIFLFFIWKTKSPTTGTFPFPNMTRIPIKKLFDAAFGLIDECATMYSVGADEIT